jgi:hypothetical protein
MSAPSLFGVHVFRDDPPAFFLILDSAEIALRNHMPEKAWGRLSLVDIDCGVLKAGTAS